MTDEAVSRVVVPVEVITVEICPKCGNILTDGHEGSIFCFNWTPRNQYPKAESH